MASFEKPWEVASDDYTTWSTKEIEQEIIILTREGNKWEVEDTLEELKAELDAAKERITELENS